MLQASDIAVGYPEKTILQGVSLSADKGERIALLGLNGTGKSTLMLSLAGLLPLKSGEVQLNGQAMRDMSSSARAAQLAVVTTDRFKTGNMTAREVVAMGRYPYTGMFGKLKANDIHAVDKATEICGLRNIQGQMFSQLSDGQKQRAMIARAIAQETPVVLLDEPTSFLDVRGKVEVFQLLSHLNDRLVVFSTHEVQLAEKVASRFWAIGDNGAVHDFEADADTRLNIRQALGLEH